MNSKTNPKIVIVGAGIAGLTTAYHLHKCGLDVEVYEARNRVGGRIFTAHINDKIVEFGGQNIHDGGNAENVHQLINELGLSTISRKASLNPIYLEEGSLIQVNNVLKTFPLQGEELKRKLKHLAATSHTMRDILDKLFDQTIFRDKILYHYAESYLAGYCGAMPEHVSTFYVEILFHILTQDICFADQASLPHTSVKGGNSRLTQALADTLTNHVHLNRPLRAISRNATGKYKLIFDKEIVLADIVVLTIPCSVYKDITFEDNIIPHERLTKIKNVHYGTIAKIMVPLTETLNSSQNIFNDKFLGLFNVANDVFVFYYIGDAGYFSETTIVDTYQKSTLFISQIFGKECMPYNNVVMASDRLYGAYNKPVGHSWLNDPFAQGSYFYIAPGQEKILTVVEDVNGVLVKSLFAPIHHSLYFAGEHCALPEEDNGTIQGACNSGIRVVKNILISLGLTPIVKAE